MKILFKTFLLTLGILSLFGFSLPALVSAQASKKDVCDGIGASVGAKGCTEGNGRSVTEIMALVINAFSWIVGVVAVLFAIIAGFKYITSGGDASAIKSAKDTIFYVIIGLVIVALSQIIVNFVLDKTNDIGQQTPAGQVQMNQVA